MSNTNRDTQTTLGDRWQDWRDGLGGSAWWKWPLRLLALYLVLALLLGMYWSLTPARFDVSERARRLVAEEGGQVVTGTVTTSALIGVMETLLDKPGGYLRNDRFPPGLWLDNMPSWEYGALIQSRDLARAMREVHSRSQSQSTEDEDLVEAEPRFNFNANSWVLPASESEYRKGVEFLRGYLKRLSDQDARNAQFYARADNLRYWLNTVDSRLGSLSQRLSASVGQRRLNTDLAGDESARQSTGTPGEMVVRTPWLEIDDVFFEARGTAWALIQFLKAAEIDFADVLEKKNARVSLQQIIRELESTQDAMWSPMVLNGTGFGVLANHSLVMANYLSRANAAIIDLRDLLAQG
ncbi:DUF2333 family protein [Parahaliea mediterranea]|uniref:DUF2333 family protein n=1 Tax=Parahaliea mediterranea TaxID=651086 RepID=A0A939DJ52_9GAMM|nr:DUF2333 family protein [Parahaliea mediterranea]MBN7799105.1 DUF2333 family protein [Parahaliea mediterranea]